MVKAPIRAANVKAPFRYNYTTLAILTGEPQQIHTALWWRYRDGACWLQLYRSSIFTHQLLGVAAHNLSTRAHFPHLLPVFTKQLHRNHCILGAFWKAAFFCQLIFRGNKGKIKGKGKVFFGKAL